MTFENTQCYLCGGSDIRLHQGIVRDRKDLKVLKCGVCGLIFLSSFSHIRMGFYEDSCMFAEQVDPEEMLKATATDDERRHRFLTSSLPDSDVLDFGCGTGGFLIRAKTVSKSVCGIEPDKGLAEHLARNNIRVTTGIPELENSNKAFDLITLFHVLEHLPNPVTVLGQLAGLLKDAGQMIIEVPNADDALLSLYGSQAFSEFTYWSCHLYTSPFKVVLV